MPTAPVYIAYMHRFILATALLLAPATVHAADEAKACPATPAALADPWTAWAGPVKAIDSGRTTAAMPGLVVGAPFALKLFSPAEVTLVAPDGKPIDPARFSGLASLDLARASRVGIALSDGAWLDVLSRGAAQSSIEHGHGPDCSGIRKIVWFDLQPGIHVIQIMNSPKPSITGMAVVAQPVVD